MLYTRREFFYDEILLALTLQTTVQGSLSIEVKADNANKVLKRQGSGGTNGKNRRISIRYPIGPVVDADRRRVRLSLVLKVLFNFMLFLRKEGKRRERNATTIFAEQTKMQSTFPLFFSFQYLLGKLTSSLHYSLPIFGLFSFVSFIFFFSPLRGNSTSGLIEQKNVY